MITIGIDPGTTKIGFGVIKSEKNNMISIDYGIIKNQTPDKKELFLKTESELNRIIDLHRPDRAVVEKLFFFKNQKTVMAVGELRGVILSVFYRRGIPVLELTPLEIKKSISGYGVAEKAQIQKMVQMILGLKEKITPDDAADALAAAICGSVSG